MEYIIERLNEIGFILKWFGIGIAVLVVGYFILRVIEVIKK